ncbi:MAG: hypothetical protein J5736_02250 [Bacilli bacterium]|nr:hypothetical protein [Bacilli bacterium]
MKAKIASIVALFVVIFVFTSGLIEPITNVFVWLITLNFNSPDVSVFGQLVAKYGTWIITYALVGSIFGFLGWFNRDAMKIVYFIISTIVSFLLSWLIMALEKHLLVIAIVVGSLLLLAAIGLTAFLIVRKKKSNQSPANPEQTN